MRKFIMFNIVIALFISGKLFGGSSADNSISPAEGTIQFFSLPPTRTPFGVSLAHEMPDDLKLKIAGDLGVNYYRTTATIREGTFKTVEEVPDPNELMAAGYQIPLNIRNYGTDEEYSKAFQELGERPDKLPELPPTDLAAYKETVGKIIEQYHPAIVIISNEENLHGMFLGTPQQYETTLRYVDDSEALGEVVNVFQQETGRPIITNETGQLNLDPNITTARMEKIASLGMQLAVWYSSDSTCCGRIFALNNRDGSLRPTGEAFKKFIDEHYAAGDFSLSFAQSEVTVARGKRGDFTVNIDRTGGFAGNVTVVAPDTKKLKITVTPSSLTTAGDSATFSFKVKKSAPVGTHELMFTAKDESGRVRTATLTVTIQLRRRFSHILANTIQR